MTSGSAQAVQAPSKASESSRAAAPTIVPSLRAGPAIGNQARLRQLQARLTVGPVDDPLEREADLVAAQILGTPAAPTSEISPAPVQASRKCAGCEEENLAQRDIAPGGQVSTDVAPALVDAAIASPAQPLDGALRALVEPRLGRSLDDVRVHQGGAADAGARSVGARAFTVGRDVVFADGEYAPDTPPGRELLVHELVHVAQQDGGYRAVQRKCGHDGTPVNCHNWGLGMFPWLAGSIAHSQIAAWAGIPWHSIPRATKLLMGMPSVPGTPWGFADLWENGAGAVRIGEIKSTATGSAVAAAEVAHYVIRHDESMARGPGAPDDMAYQAAVGPMSKIGAPLDLSGRTSTGVAVGPFVGDPGKQLWAEADSLGALVYWCMGAGLPSPLWLLAFKAAMDALKKQLAALKRMMSDIVDGVIAGGRALARWITGVIGDIVDWGAANSRALAFAALMLILLVALVLVIISLLAEAPSAGTSTAVLIPSIIAVGGAAAGIMMLVGASSPGLPQATAAVASAVRPQEADASVTGASYDAPMENASARQAAATATAPTSDPGAQLTTALAALMDPATIAAGALNAFSGGARESQGLAAANAAIAALRGAGAGADADAALAQMRSTGLA